MQGLRLVPALPAPGSAEGWHCGSLPAPPAAPASLPRNVQSPGGQGRSPGQRSPCQLAGTQRLAKAAICPSPDQGKGAGFGRVRRAGEGGGMQERKNKTKSKPSEAGATWASLGNGLCELYEIDKHLPSCFLNIPLFCKACSAHEPQSQSLWSGRKN